MIITVGQMGQAQDALYLKMWRTCVDPAMRMWQDHRHSNFEVAMVLRGEGVYRTVSGDFPIETGDVFVFPSNEPHWILEIGSGGLEIMNLHFSEGFFGHGCTIARKYPNLFFAHSDGFSSRIPAGEAEGVCRILLHMAEELGSARAEYDTCIYAGLDMLFALLLRCHGYYQPGEGVHTAVERMQNSLRFIDAHFAEDITLEQIAEQSGLSPHYFSRLFRDVFRMKLWDHVLSRRIEAAKQMLMLDGDKTVLEIALACGFHNTANFNRVFLRFTGMTPSEFKKSGLHLL